MVTLLVLLSLVGPPPYHPSMAHAATEDCGYRTVRDGTVFTLDIERSFDSPVTFQLCERTPPEISFVLVTTTKSSKKLPVDDATYKSIYSLYEASLDFDLRDSAMGSDGSVWCLETKRGFAYSKSCFWSPDHNSEQRRLGGLHALGVRLWQLAHLDPMKLY